MCGACWKPQQTWPQLCMNVVVTTVCDKALLPRSFSLCDGKKARVWDGRAGGGLPKSGSTAPGAHWLGGLYKAKTLGRKCGS